MYYRQINLQKIGPLGYNSDGLIEVNMMTPEIRKNYEVLKTELLNTGYVKNVSRSMGSVTADYGGTTDIHGKEKQANSKPLFMSSKVTHEYGKHNWLENYCRKGFFKEFGLDQPDMVHQSIRQRTNNGIQKPAE